MRLLNFLLFPLLIPYQSAHEQMALKAPAVVPRTIIVIGTQSSRRVAINSSIPSQVVAL